MRWGVRKDESTALSKPKKTQRLMAEEARRQKASDNRALLSDADLKKRIERLEAEKKLKTLTDEQLNPGKAAVNAILSTSGKRVATTVLTGVALYSIKAAMTRSFNLRDAAGYIVPKPKK